MFFAPGSTHNRAASSEQLWFINYYLIIKKMFNLANKVLKMAKNNFNVCPRHDTQTIKAIDKFHKDPPFDNDSVY
jgi:hypothetical protein